MPVRQSGSLRLIGVVPQEHEQDETITFESIRKEIEEDQNTSLGIILGSLIIGISIIISSAIR